MTLETIGRYQLIEEIGRGGMGAVYRARDTLLGRDVALKLLPRHLSQEGTFYERFRREAQIVAQLEHPYIVPIYDFGIHEEQPFLVMRLLTGGTFRDRIQDRRLAPDELWPILQQVASALDMAHNQGIVHRDVKPTNILFDNRGDAFMSDFGIAKVLSSDTQLTGSGLIGSPAYMSPEQFGSDKIDGGADQYSLAIVIFEALTGSLPFTGDTARVMFQHLQSQPPAIHTMTQLPEAATAVLHRALNKDPKNRFPTIIQFIQILAAATHLAPDDPLIETLSKPTIIMDDPQPALTPMPTPPPEQTGSGTDHFRPIQPTERVRLPAAPPTMRESASEKNEGSPSRQRPFIWMGALVILALIVATIFILRPRDETPETSSLNPGTVINSPGVPSEIAIMPGAGGLDWQSGESSGTVTAADSLNFTVGQPLRLENGAGVSELTLSTNDTRLFLDAESSLVLEEITANNTLLEIMQGTLLVVAGSNSVDIRNILDGHITLETGVLAVTFAENPFKFQADCMAGICIMSTPQLGERTLTANQALCDGSGCAAGGAEMALHYEQYTHLSNLVPTPTSTPIPSHTPEPTEMATALPSSTSLATPINSFQVRITLSSVNLRSGPGTGYPILGRLQQDDIVAVIERSNDNSWYLIALDEGRVAWLAASVTEVVTPTE